MFNVLFLPSVQPEGDAGPVCALRVPSFLPATLGSAMSQDGGKAENYRSRPHFAAARGDYRPLLYLLCCFYVLKYCYISWGQVV